MYSLVTMVTNIHMTVAKTVDLQCSHHKKKIII